MAYYNGGGGAGSSLMGRQVCVRQVCLGESGQVDETLSFSIQIEACLFNPTFYKGSHLKGLKQRALHAHQTNTKTFHRKAFCTTH